MSINYKLERIRNGLTQDQVANKAYISRSTLSRIENGTAEPSQEIKMKLLEIYGVNDDSINETSYVDKTTLKDKFESSNTIKILYAIIVLSSIVTVPYGVFPAAVALYMAIKNKYSKVIIILNALWLLFLIYDFMLIVFRIYLIPGMDYYQDIS